MLTGEAKKQATKEAMRRYRASKKGITEVSPGVTVIPSEEVIPLKLEAVEPEVIPQTKVIPKTVIPFRPHAVMKGEGKETRIGYGLPFGKDVQSRGAMR